MKKTRKTKPRYTNLTPLTPGERELVKGWEDWEFEDDKGGDGYAPPGGEITLTGDMERSIMGGYEPI